MSSATVNVVALSDLAASPTAFRFDGRDHGSSLSFFVTQHPRGGGPPLHRHPYDETFLIQEGTATFSVDGRSLEVAAGNVVVVPAGATHGFVNAAEPPLRLVSLHPYGQVVVQPPEGAR